jgi:HEPN superfamily Apea-like protein
MTERKQNGSPSYMFATFNEIATGFDSVLRRWFECDERVQPVLDLYFAVISNRDASCQVQFLLLAQAIEVYHARSKTSNGFRSTVLSPSEHKARLKLILDATPSDLKDWLKEKLAYSNQMTLRERIDDILNLHRDESARLTGKLKDFADKLRESRNYYTHYGEDLWQSGKVAKGPELTEIRFIIEHLLKVCLLKELGLQGTPIERVLAQNASAKFIHLETPPVQKPPLKKDLSDLDPDPGLSDKVNANLNAERKDTRPQSSRLVLFLRFLRRKFVWLFNDRRTGQFGKGR